MAYQPIFLSPPVRRRLLRRISGRVFKMLLITAIFVVITIPIYRFQYWSKPSGLPGSPVNLGDGQDGVLILGAVESVDTTNLQVQFMWAILGCGSDYCADCSSDTRCGTLSQSVAVFMDSDTSGLTFTNGTGAPGSTVDLTSVNATATISGSSQSDGWSSGDVVSRQNSVPFFNSVEPVDFAQVILNRLSAGDAFPLDKYQVFSSFIVVSTTTNSTLPVTGIVPYVLIGSGDSWDLHISAVNVTSAPVGISLRMSRPQTFIVFVVAVFVVNWCITLAVIMLTVWVILLRISDKKSPSEAGNAQRGIASAPANSSGSLNEDEPEPATQEWRSVPLEVLSSLPLTALFSMPALRTSINYPINVASDGSGFISCIVIVAVCTALMLGMLALNLTWISFTSARKFVRTNTLQGTHLEEAHALEPLRDRRSPTTMRTSPLHMNYNSK